MTPGKTIPKRKRLKDKKKPRIFDPWGFVLEATAGIETGEWQFAAFFYGL